MSGKGTQWSVRAEPAIQRLLRGGRGGCLAAVRMLERTSSVMYLGVVVRQLPRALYVTVGHSTTGPVGFTWRLWSSGTSFYLKARTSNLRHLKLSFHGDDPRHPQGGGFKLGMDTEAGYREDIDTGRILSSRTGQWPIWFPGTEIGKNATLVGRLRWTWDACTRLGRGPYPGDLKKDAIGLVVPAPPEPGYAVDVDLIVSSEKPFWIEEQSARAENACLGPLRNNSGQWLTGTAVKRFAPHYPPPTTAIGPRPRSKTDQVRAVGAAVGPEGFVWLLEQRMSLTGLADLAK